MPLAPAQDFKRVGDGDRGPNTGRHGRVRPDAPCRRGGMVDSIMATAVEPSLAALHRRGIDYRGVLYAGLMLSDDGPKVIEYNVRFGDPETQVVLPLLAGDVAALFMAVATGTLGRVGAPAFSGDAAVCVVMASRGYPESAAGRWQHHRVDGVGTVDRPRRRGDRLPCRHQPARSGGAVRHGRGTGPGGDGSWRRRSRWPGPTPTTALEPISWDGSRCGGYRRRCGRLGRGGGVAENQEELVR